MKSSGSLAWLLLLSVSACGAASRAAAPRGSVASPAFGARSGEVIQDAAVREDDGVPAPSGPVWGTPTALVTVVEFADFECPFCARAEPTLVKAREIYGPETLRIVWKNMPLPFREDALRRRRRPWGSSS